MFIILGLPRSRTAWLSRFLSYWDWHCGHDELRHMRSLGDIKTWLTQPNTGTVETAAAPWWRLMLKYAPDAKIITVRRPVEEVIESVERLGITGTDTVMRAIDRKLDQIERRIPGVMSVKFSDLADETVCAKLFEHCLPYRHDPEHWRKLDAENIQIDMPALIRYCRAFKPQIDKLAAQATQQVRGALMARPGRCADGMTIQIEPFADAYRDGVALFNEHLVQTDQHPDDYLKKNAPLLQRLDESGHLQVVTARQNGRMFGYMVTVITPSLDSETVTMAQQTTFFASADFPGLGLKMERASVRFLEDRGVDEVLFHEGIRGDGPRMGALYRRIGADPYGQLYKLQLNRQ